MPDTKPKREPRKVLQIVVRDASCKPGIALMERIAHVHVPLPEDLAILDAWTPRLVIPVLAR